MTTIPSHATDRQTLPDDEHRRDDSPAATTADALITHPLVAPEVTITDRLGGRTYLTPGAAIAHPVVAPEATASDALIVHPLIAPGPAMADLLIAHPLVVPEATITRPLGGRTFVAPRPAPTKPVAEPEGTFTDALIAPFVYARSFIARLFAGNPGSLGPSQFFGRSQSPATPRSASRGLALCFALVLAAALGGCAHAQATPAPPAEPEPELPQTPDLTADKVGQLFDCVTALQHQRPEALYWVSPLDGADGLFVTTQFHYSFTRKYSGHEIAIFSRDRAAYYWMPGAQHDATGFVAQGHYRVDAELPDHSRALRLTFDKRSPTAFVLVHQGPDDASATGPVNRILPRPLPVAIIKEDLHEMAFFAVTFHAQALRAESIRGALLPAVAPEAFASCRHLTQRLDTALAGLDDALAGGDATRDKTAGATASRNRRAQTASNDPSEAKPHAPPS